MGNPVWGDHAGTNLASFIRREYGSRAYSLGFSALTGSFRQGKGNFPVIPAAPAASVKAQAFQDTSASAVYVDPTALAAMGTRPGAFSFTPTGPSTGHIFLTGLWCPSGTSTG